MRVKPIENESSMIERNDSITQSSQSQSNFNLDFFKDQIKEIPKKTIHPIVFMLNIFWMLFCCYCNLYYVYGSTKEIQQKGKLAGIALGFTTVIGLPTFFYLVSFKQFIRLVIIFDTIMVVTIAAALAFVNLILLFDKTDDWFWTVIEVGFSLQLVCTSTMARVFLVHLKWQKWQLLVFKISIMMNCLMFLISGVFFICVDFSYTQHFMAAFDSKVHDFMLLFIFSLFSYSFELYSKVTDLDHTGDLKYLYTLKNCDSTLPKKKNSIMKNRRQSINSIKNLRNSYLQKNNGPAKPSRFAQIQNIE